MLSQLGVHLPPGTNLQLKNVAAVMVTAQLPAFAQPGQLLDVTVSSLGNAKSLRGGTLLATPLKGADGQIYAHGAGQRRRRRRRRVGGRQQGADQPAQRRPHPRRRDRRAQRRRRRSAQGDFVQLELRDSDFGDARAKSSMRSTAASGSGSPTPSTAASCASACRRRPTRASRSSPSSRTSTSQASLPAAKVIINARTGSIVMNQAVTIDACAVAHGNLTVRSAATP